MKDRSNNNKVPTTKKPQIRLKSKSLPGILLKPITARIASTNVILYLEINMMTNIISPTSMKTFAPCPNGVAHIESVNSPTSGSISNFIVTIHLTPSAAAQRQLRPMPRFVNWLRCLCLHSALRSHSGAFV